MATVTDVQLFDTARGEVVPFDPALQQSIESLSTLAAAALESYERVHK